MRGNAVFQRQVLSEPRQFLVRPAFNLDEGVRSGQYRIDGHYQHFDQIMLRLPGMAWIGE
jgi:hypothetical protein